MYVIQKRLISPSFLSLTASLNSCFLYDVYIRRHHIQQISYSINWQIYWEPYYHHKPPFKGMSAMQIRNAYHF